MTPDYLIDATQPHPAFTVCPRRRRSSVDHPSNQATACHRGLTWKGQPANARRFRQAGPLSTWSRNTRPDACGLVQRRRDDARPVGAEGAGIDGLVPAENFDLVPRGSIPNANGHVGRRRDDARPVRAEDDRTGRALVPSEYEMPVRVRDSSRELRGRCGSSDSAHWKGEVDLCSLCGKAKSTVYVAA
jgi:hypothetical protein